ncbi:unnamed protein product [Mycena citricolor]|uniref:F-box domain-containing protein n=1 Tax=Mycena citricolor TaxID=2018698 RepID=A0AAD2GTI2_9AGAR|nr:unnamed protein product [Mycena citricolor]
MTSLPSSSSLPPATPPPNRLRRRGSPSTPLNPSVRFSRFFTSVLGSPFLTTAEISSLPPHLDLIDGDDAAVLREDTVTRPPSPDTGELALWGFEVVHHEDDDGVWAFRRSASPFRSLLPRIWDVLSPSPPRRQLTLFSNHPNHSDSSLWNMKSIDYAQLAPLDGEEGELIDDEACFFYPPVRAVTGIDILTLLPPELSLHILSLLLSPPDIDLRAAAPTVLAGIADHNIEAAVSVRSLLTCRSVSRGWAHLASDNAVWRAGYFSRWGVPSTPHLDVARMKKLPALPPDQPALKAVLAPLATDWYVLYQARLELSRRWASSCWDPRATALAGHTDSVYCLEFSGKHIVTGSRDRSVKIWGIRSGRLLGTLSDGHDGSVLCLKFEMAEEDGRLLGSLFTGSSDCTVRVWDLWTESAGEDAPVFGQVRAVLRGHTGGVLDLRVADKWIVSCSKDTSIRIWARDTLEPHKTLCGHDGPVNAVGLEGRDGKTLVSASGDGKMILWNIATGDRVRTFEGHERGLACIEYKGDLIISGSNDCKIKIWSASSGACLRTLTGHESLVRALAFDPSTGRLVSGGYDRSVRVWDLCTGRSLRVFRDNHTSHIFDVKFDAQRIVSTSHDQRIVILDFAQGLDVEPSLLV